MGLIKHSNADIRALQKNFDKQCFTDSDGYLVKRTRNMRKSNAAPTQPHRSAPRHRRQREGMRSSVASGDGNNNEPEPEPDPERHFRLLTQADLADLLSISTKTLQNVYSRTPHLLPLAVVVPGARGPRWTTDAVQAWLDSRPAHTSKPAPAPLQRKVGRPRIALAAVKGGAK